MIDIFRDGLVAMADNFEDVVRRVVAAESNVRALDLPAASARIDRIDNPFLVGPLIERLTPYDEHGPRVHVRRPDDHLVLDLSFDNLRIAPDGDAAARLVRENPGRRGVLIVEFPPQCFGEEAFLAEGSGLDIQVPVKDELPPQRNGLPVEADNTATAAKQKKLDPKPEPLSGRLPARVRMSSPSRVAFRMPEQMEALPFTLEAVLAAMRDWPMNLDVGARADELFAVETTPFGAPAEKAALKTSLTQIRSSVETQVNGFLIGAERLAILELTEISNTKATLRITEQYLSTIMAWARKHRQARKVLIVWKRRTRLSRRRSARGLTVTRNG